ncbi:hypothetical protein J6590_074779 [Homalodisca vitripennis]|nr:hypothetical protein J6590_074779 [Homalodisca vitripennis]
MVWRHATRALLLTKSQPSVTIAKLPFTGEPAASPDIRGSVNRARGHFVTNKASVLPVTRTRCCPLICAAIRMYNIRVHAITFVPTRLISVAEIRSGIVTPLVFHNGP